MNAKFVGQTLTKLFARHGAPAFIRSDNGPEFIAKHLMRVLSESNVSPRHIDPGSPWQNGRSERFNGTLLDECLNMETFFNREHARVLIGMFVRKYNQHRPHSSLGGLTPREFAMAWREKNKASFADGELFSPPEDTGSSSRCLLAGAMTENQQTNGMFPLAEEAL